MDSMFVMLDLFVAGFGVYIFYAWYLMSTTGEVKEGLVLPKGMKMSHCKDKEGFIAYLKPRMLVFALATFGCGIMGLLNDFTDILSWLYLVVTLIFLALVIWFAREAKKAVKKYF